MSLNLTRKLIAVGLAVTVPFSGIGVANSDPGPDHTAQAEVFEENFPEEAFVEALRYNTVTGKYELDEKTALAYGASPESIQQFTQNLDNMSAEDIELLNEVIDFTPNTSEPPTDVSTRAIPAILIPVLKVVGTGAASAIVGAVTKWGISGACKNLKGKYEKFDSFCVANGWQ